MNQTIKTVKDNAREWNSDRGVMCYVGGTFEDGSGWELGCKPENVQDRIATMRSLIGQPGEFDLKPRADYNGQKQWTIKDYPGKQSFSTGGGGVVPVAGGSGKAPFVPRYRDSEEGFLREQRSIHRSVAVEWAVTWLVSRNNPTLTISDVRNAAEDLYQWLSQDAPPTPQAPPAAPSGPPAQYTEPPRTLANHPSLDEMRERFDLTTGDRVPAPTSDTAESAYAKYIKLIAEATTAARLQEIMRLIDGSHDKHTVSDLERTALFDRLIAREKALQSH